MRKTITVSLPEKIACDLDRAAAKEGLSRSDIVRESLQEHLFLRRFRDLQRRIGAKARARGLHTDQDVFDRVS
ncbi:MAG: ribbon-helix-helix protein, CopG family [Planctomycetota bacterium]